MEGLSTGLVLRRGGAKMISPSPQGTSGARELEGYPCQLRNVRRRPRYPANHPTSPIGFTFITVLTTWILVTLHPDSPFSRLIASRASHVASSMRSDAV